MKVTISSLWFFILLAPSSAIYQGYRNLFVSVGSSLDLNCGAPNIFQPFIFLEIIRMDGITQLIPDGHKVTLTGRVVTINGTDRSMRGRVVCKVISSCNQAQEDVDLGNLLPVPLKGKRLLQTFPARHKLFKGQLIVSNDFYQKDLSNALRCFLRLKFKIKDLSLPTSGTSASFLP